LAVLVAMMALSWTCTTAQNTTTCNDAQMMWKRLNQQINIEWTAGYAYESMATYFARPSVGLRGFAKFFRKSADEEFGHARKIEDYVNKRRHNVTLDSIQLPTVNSPVFPQGLPRQFDKPVAAISASLELEKNVTECLRSLHQCAGESSEPQTQDFLDGFLEEQIESIEELTILKTRLERGKADEIISHLIDKELLGD